VQEALDRVERDHRVRVLYACESGSRAWGFASRDSDYDVRFVYVHEPDWYLSVEERRDVVEMPLSDELDVSGWELRKALRLLRKSNPPLLEWLKSPLVYRRDESFVAGFNVLAEEYYSPKRCFAHYLHMAAGNWRSYLQGRDLVSLKKYLYVFRPLLACRWLERRLGQVPMEFQSLVDAVLDEREVRQALEDLLVRKRAGNELSVAAPVQVLSRFIEAELSVLDSLVHPAEPAPSPERLNQFFRQYAQAA
jgi:predicted nucleotidyltransferase